MSGTFPKTPCPSGCRISSQQPSRISVAQSLKTQRRTSNVQRFSIALDYPSMSREMAERLVAFRMSQRGQADTFTLALPIPFNRPLGPWSGVPLVANDVTSPTAPQTGRTLYLDGATHGVIRWAIAGDYFKLAGQTKLYKVTADADSDSSGVVELRFEPALLQSPADNEAIIFNDVPLTVAFTDDGTDYSVTPGPRHGLFSVPTMTMIEVA